MGLYRMNLKENNMEKYVLMNTICPECAGEGKTETMTWLTYDGDQTWKVEMCEKCSGSGSVEVPAKCFFCEDEVLESEQGEFEYVCHAYCLEESRQEYVVT